MITEWAPLRPGHGNLSDGHHRSSPRTSPTTIRSKPKRASLDSATKLHHLTRPSFFHHPDTICNEQALQSVICRPAHDEHIRLDADAAQWTSTYRVAGYAYSGGGVQIQRVELSLDGGQTWRYAFREHVDDWLRCARPSFVLRASKITSARCTGMARSSGRGCTVCPQPVPCRRIADYGQGTSTCRTPSWSSQASSWSAGMWDSRLWIVHIEASSVLGTSTRCQRRAPRVGRIRCLLPPRTEYSAREHHGAHIEWLLLPP
jgi:hypothetical protein